MKLLILCAALAALSACMKQDNAIISTRGTYSPLGFDADSGW